MLLAAACLLPLVWPEDIPFINDEPKLVALALDANASHRLAPIGLFGTYGLHYGPGPVWIYQALLAMTHDLVVVAFLHAAMKAAATAAALWWLFRSLRLWVWFLPIPLLSPYFWYYARMLWDNSHLIPLGTLALAGYAAHLSTNSRAGLRVAVACVPAMVLVHLMALAFVIPLTAHMLLVRWRSVRADWRVVGVLVVGAGVLAWPYWTYLFNAWSDAGSPTAGHVRGWWFPLTGGRLLSADRLDYFFGSAGVEGAVLEGTALVSRISHVLVLGGAAIAAVRLWTVRRQSWTPREHLIVIAFGALLCQMLFDGITGKWHHPHYHNGTWIAFVLFAWIATDWVVQRRSPLRWLAPVATGVLAAALVTSVTVLAFRIRTNGGTRDTYGPTLANQMRVAREAARHQPPSPVRSEVWIYSQFPHTFETLKRLLGPGGAPLPPSPLRVRYASDDPAKGVIELTGR